MSGFSWARSCLCLLLSGALVACVAPIKRTIEPASRAIDGGRELSVSIPQSEIRADVNASNIAAATGGGLLFALIDVAVTQSRASSAEEAIKQLRDGLVGYNFDQLALQTTTDSLARIDWLDLRKTTFTKEFSEEKMARSLDESNAPQLVMVHYDYSLNAGFTALQVAWTISVIPKAPPAGQPVEKRLQPANWLYNQPFLCVEPLNAPSDEKEANVSKWAAESAALTRSGIEKCLSRFEYTTRRSLDLSEESRGALKKGKQQNRSGYVGWEVETDAQGTLLLDYAERFIFVFNTPA